MQGVKVKQKGHGAERSLLWQGLSADSGQICGEVLCISCALGYKGRGDPSYKMVTLHLRSEYLGNFRTGLGTRSQSLVRFTIWRDLAMIWQHSKGVRIEVECRRWNIMEELALFAPSLVCVSAIVYQSQ